MEQEIKNTKKLSLPIWWKQIYNDNTSKIPVNIFKMNGKFYSTLELTDWLSDLAEVQELKEEVGNLKTANKGLEDRISELERELYK